jgi:hypothetical protein
MDKNDEESFAAARTTAEKSSFLNKKGKPHTPEDLLAHEANFDASGAHLGFYYPEEYDEEEDEQQKVEKTQV